MTDLDFAHEIINDLKEDFENNPNDKSYTISFNKLTEKNTNLELVKKEIEKEFNLKQKNEFWIISRK